MREGYTDIKFLCCQENNWMPPPQQPIANYWLSYIAHLTAPMQEWHGSFLGPVHTYTRVPEDPKSERPNRRIGVSLSRQQSKPSVGGRVESQECDDKSLKKKETG